MGKKPNSWLETPRGSYEAVKAVDFNGREIELSETGSIFSYKKERERKKHLPQATSISGILLHADFQDKDFDSWG